jgi:hypothetical protein
MLCDRELFVVWRHPGNIEGDMVLRAKLVQIGQEFLIYFTDSTPLELRGKKYT